ncbi:PadR family transcriptional regulator [Microbacterium sp. P06]|uniref:PadR family transcriptional regulator n=1 Tax=Microbacterium sp. P06 TaxID=3366949 RepID=UPI00374676D7
MTVRHALLAILDQGSCYGYQLRAEYARRTGAAVNVGQIYTTLERLERDGLVANRGADDRGHVYWGITDPGRGHVSEWLGRPDPPSGRDELAHKVALAATLPGVDAAAVISRQRSDAIDRLAGIESASSVDVAGAIVRAAAAAQARAEIEWLDAAAVAVAVDPGAAAFPLSVERPRRGRPRESE